MKTLFTDNEIKSLVEVLGAKLQVSINRAGNVKVINHNEPDTRSYFKDAHGFWVLYKYNDGTFIWRRHNGLGYCYPLNMKGRKYKGKVFHYRNNDGYSYTCGYRPFNINMAVFNSFDEALDYFVKYMNDYRGITLKR